MNSRVQILAILIFAKCIVLFKLCIFILSHNTISMKQIVRCYGLFTRKKKLLKLGMC